MGVKLFTHVNRYPMESIELLLACLLTFIGIIVLIVPIILGIVGSTVYGTYMVLVAFGLSWIASSFPIIYMRIRYSIDEYIYIYQKRRRSVLFWIMITWLYFTVLSLVKAFFPLYWAMYLIFALIAAVCHVRLYR